MKQNLRELLERISVFEDSNELSENLRAIAENELLNSPDRYLLKESAQHIDGLFSLIMDIKRSVCHSAICADNQETEK